MKVYLVESDYMINDIIYCEEEDAMSVDGVYNSVETAKEKINKAIAEKTFANGICLEASKIADEPIVEFDQDFGCSPLFCSITYKDSRGCEYYQNIYIREYEVVE